jgi:hypothetical protein
VPNAFINQFETDVQSQGFPAFEIFAAPDAIPNATNPEMVVMPLTVRSFVACLQTIPELKLQYWYPTSDAVMQGFDLYSE